MQGNPLRELILVLVLVALLMPVILGLTSDTSSPAPNDRPAVPVQPAEHTPTTIHLQFAHAPLVAGFDADREVQLRELATESELDWELDFTDRIIEWPFTVRWPEGTPRSAVTIRFEPEGFEAKEVTFWGEGSLDEFIELSWDE